MAVIFNLWPKVWYILKVWILEKIVTSPFSFSPSDDWCFNSFHKLFHKVKWRISWSPGNCQIKFHFEQQFVLFWSSFISSSTLFFFVIMIARKLILESINGANWNSIKHKLRVKKPSILQFKKKSTKRVTKKNRIRLNLTRLHCKCFCCNLYDFCCNLFPHLGVSTLDYQCTYLN